MNARVNDCLRRVIGSGIYVFGLGSAGLMRLRMLRYEHNQQRLRRKYGLTRDTPVLSYGPQVAQSIATKRHKIAAKNLLCFFVATSGSTGKPKQILYTKRRLLDLKLTFSEMFASACYAFGIKRTSLYVFNSFQSDASLTSLLLDENKLPSYFSLLQAPYRVQHSAAIQSLVAKYGSAAVRLWILTISNPGVLYSTNPSTISTFLDELERDWHRSSKLIKDWYTAAASFTPEVHKIAHRLESYGSSKRVKQIATSDAPLPLSMWAPAVETYICWTGGYIKPFLDRLAKQLPSPRYKLIPMYSMSTETIETFPYFRGDAFFPIAAGVVYEFTEEKALDHAHNLLNAHQLEPGKLYAMVVSDAYGLRRYQTDDLFVCRRKVDGLPNLAFVRRRSLEYSFTGEKLTAEQLTIVFEQLRAQYPSLLTDRFLTCVPTQSSDTVPHYELLLVGDQSHTSEASHDLIAARCDELLGEINCEYRSKRFSGRLGPIQCTHADIRDFAETFASNSAWETQFKFLPLLRNPVLI